MLPWPVLAPASPSSLRHGGRTAVPKGLPLVADNTAEYAFQTARRASRRQGTGPHGSPLRKD